MFIKAQNIQYLKSMLGLKDALAHLATKKLKPIIYEKIKSSLQLVLKY
jgi:hypothetical protein